MGNVIELPIRRKSRFSKKNKIIAASVSIVLSVIFLFTSYYSPFRVNDFGELKWRISKQDIVTYESREGISDYEKSIGEDIALGYTFELLDFKSSKIYNKKGDVRYIFLNNKLVGCTYNFYFNGNLNEYEDLINTLSNIYGKPKESLEVPTANKGEDNLFFQFKVWRSRHANISLFYRSKDIVTLHIEDPTIFNNIGVLNSDRLEHGIFKAL